MKKLLIVVLAAASLYSCTTQKEIVKKEEKSPVVIEKKKTLEFSFEIEKPKTNSSLRGISVVDSLTAWACGSKGTFVHTSDGGKTWTEGKVKGFEPLDFRDVEAFDKNTAIIMSVDAPAFFFKTYDGGKTWKRKYMNRNPKIFFDGMAFWDEKNGIAFSDPIDGRFFIVITKNGGETWKEIPSINIPVALPGEGAFAASGTAISVSGKDLVWFGCGGSDRSRIYFSEDSGENWRAIEAPIKSGNSSSGIFSVCFKDDLNGIAVGGDYKNDKSNNGNCAFSDDGGLSWQAIDKSQPGGFKSCVVWNDKYKFYLTTGTSGSDYSLDDGKTWISIDQRSYNSIGFSKKDGSCFMVGDKGAIAKVRVK
ncbi:MAG: hypothetical protein M1495_13155 [Bacteroidetes bacterium]|nr:hypothetical protein [Bacteroidota bacterium]MCL6097099.1 hypothetical protein [Bacteroidota bacterium]